MAFWDGVGASSRADGDVRYRVTEHGTRIGVLPATCKRGLHSLAATGYSHAVNDAENLLRITCPACLAEPHPDHTWRLRTTPPAPTSAELDDSVYRDIEPQLQARPVPSQALAEPSGSGSGGVPAGSARRT